MRKAYAGDEGAQIHYRQWGPLRDGVNGWQNPIFLLPPAPHSSLFFTKIAPLLTQNRHVIAVDYPGYGGSDYRGRYSIKHYADVLMTLLPAETKSVVIGFHSGCFVGYELARQARGRVSDLIMIDVPFFDDDKRKSYAAALSTPSKTPQNISDLEVSFDKNVTSRQEDLGLERALDLWTESLRAGDMKNAAFQAAFAYDAKSEFLNPPQGVNINVIATTSSLLEPSRKAAGVIPRAVLTECPEIDRAVMDVFAVNMSETIYKTLNG